MGRVDHLNAEGYDQPLVEVRRASTGGHGGVAWEIKVNGIIRHGQYVIADTADEAVTTAQAMVMREYAHWRPGAL